MTSPHGPTVRRRRLGSELRRLREEAGFTLAKAAAELDTSDSTLSRMETGRGRIRRTDVQAMLVLYGVDDEALSEGLVRLAREVRSRGWWQDYRDVVSAPYADYISLESDAVSIQVYTIQLVPGLLQTEAYARAVAEAWLVWETPGQIDSFVAVRSSRQAVLTGDEPLKLWAVMNELALRQQVGGPAVMREQLAWLVDAAKLPNVTLQVLPWSAGAHPGMDEPFAILGFAELIEPDVVHLDHLTSTLYLERPEETGRYSLVFDHLRSAALAPRASTALIAEILEET